METIRKSRTRAQKPIGWSVPNGDSDSGDNALDQFYNNSRGVRGVKSFKFSRSYPRGSILFVEGQKPRGVYVLCEGRVKVSISSAEGKALVLRLGRPGDLLGMNATLIGRPYGATVETLDLCRIDFIPREDVLKLLYRDKLACLGVAQALSRKLSGIVDHTRLLFLSNSASEKLARLLVSWCDEHGKRTANGIHIKCGLTHEEIAQMICVSRETVTRVLNKFKQRHILSLAKGDILIRSRRALEAEARF